MSDDSAPTPRATGKDLIIALAMTASVAALALLVSYGLRWYWQQEKPGAIERPRQLVGEGDASEPPPASQPPASGPLFASAVAPSPDGSTLAWAGWTAEGAGLITLGARGGEASLLDAATPCPGLTVVWSDDGTLIAWLAAGSSGTEVRVYDTAKGRALGPFELGNAPDPAAGLRWWPGGREVLYAESGSGRLMRLAVDRPEPVPVAYGVQCSPLGSGLRVALCRDAVFAYDDVSRHRLGSPERIALTDLIEPAPDGERIAMVERPYVPECSAVEVAVAPAGYEAEPRYVRGRPLWVEVAPGPGSLAWSPGGGRLAYWMRREGPAPEIGLFRELGKARAVVLDAEAGQVVRGLELPRELLHATLRWLDERSLCFVETAAPKQRLWRVDAETGDGSVLMEGGDQA